ncbi:hypothetical protein C5706_32735, partial [Klebsiella pneumoniae]
TGHGALSISPSPFSSRHRVKPACGVNGLSIRTTASRASCISARSCSSSTGHGALSISPSPFSSRHRVKPACGVNGLSIRT